MSTIAWLLFFPVAALTLWALGQAIIHRYFTVDESTLSIFKLMLRHRGLDPSKLPDAASIEIIVAAIERAKQKAAAADVTDPKPGDWSRYLLRLLDEDADQVEQIVRDGSDKHAGSDIAGVLLKYGVVEPCYPPALSVEQFLDAAERGTLYAELDERISRREFS